MSESIDIISGVNMARFAWKPGDSGSWGGRSGVNRSAAWILGNTETGKKRGHPRSTVPAWSVLQVEENLSLVNSDGRIEGWMQVASHTKKCHVLVYEAVGLNVFVS
jgi:hypothetical protein